MQGKEVVSQEEYTEKLSASIDARENKDFIIVARTDARATKELDKTIEHGKQNKKQVRMLFLLKRQNQLMK